MEKGRHVCTHCGRIVNVTKGLSHAFAMEGRKYCTWCYHSLYFVERKATGAVPHDEFVRVADPKFIEEVIQRAIREGVS